MSTKKQKTSPKKNRHKAKKQKTISTTNKKIIYIVIFSVSIVIFFAFLPILSADFVNWDDPAYILGNPHLKNFSLKAVFSEYLVGNYHPITVISNYFEYAIWGLNPKPYHFNNLLLHIFNSSFVFLILYFLTQKNLRFAAAVAILFGIHPMHVESVAWISERKDLLYTFFYLLSILSYVFYLQKNSPLKFFILSAVFFLCSLLSKAQAVTLPVVLILIDYLQNKKITTKNILEKIPLFVLSIIFGLIAIDAQRTNGGTGQVEIELWQSFLAGNYGIIIYLVKSIIPFNMSALHPYPFDETNSLPAYFYAMPVLVSIILYFLVKNRKKQQTIVFGFAFFIVTISPVLQFFPVGQAIIAERYTYIPYIGIFIIFIDLLLQFINKNKQKRQTIVTTFFLVVLIAYAIGTWNRTKIWNNSYDLWTDVIEKYPKATTAYVNRSYILNEFKKYDQAIADCNAGIKTDSASYKLYFNRGLAYEKKKNYDKALSDYSRSLKFDSTYVKAYLNKGVIYTDFKGEYEKGIKNFKKTLELDSNNVKAAVNLGIAYYKKGDPQNAKNALTQAINRFDDGRAYYVRAVVNSSLKNYEAAYNDGIKAIEKGEKLDQKLLNTWKAQINK